MFIYFAKSATVWQGDGLSTETAFRLRGNPVGMISFCPAGDPTSWPVLAAYATKLPAQFDDNLFANDLDDSLTAALATKLETRFGVTLTERTSIRKIVAELLIQHAGGARWKPLVATAARRYEIWLGNQVIWTMPIVGGGSTVFTDNFNRADSDSLGGNWVEDTGDWDISSNTMVVATGGLCHNTTSVGSAAYEVECNISPSNPLNIRGPGIRGRAADTSNYYLLHVNDTSGINGGKGNIQLYKCIAGGFTQLGSSYDQPATLAGTNFLYKLSMNGTSIKVYVSGTQQISVTDSALSAEGNHGCRQFADGGTAFDNYAVYNFVTGVTLRRGLQTRVGSRT